MPWRSHILDRPYFSLAFLRATAEVCPGHFTPPSPGPLIPHPQRVAKRIGAKQSSARARRDGETTGPWSSPLPRPSLVRLVKVLVENELTVHSGLRSSFHSQISARWEKGAAGTSRCTVTDRDVRGTSLSPIEPRPSTQPSNLGFDRFRSEMRHTEQRHDKYSFPGAPFHVPCCRCTRDSSAATTPP